MNHKFTALAALAVCAAMAGCRRPHKTVVVTNPEQQQSKPTTVVIEKGHAHSSTCGHYHHNGHWYSDPDHVYVIE